MTIPWNLLTSGIYFAATFATSCAPPLKLCARLVVSSHAGSQEGLVGYPIAFMTEQDL
jgi:hypothetical protein